MTMYRCQCGWLLDARGKLHCLKCNVLNTDPHLVEKAHVFALK